jgi:hypothetical protein
MMDSVERPIFIVGSGRSGTTIFYRLMAGHPNLVWFSSYIQSFPRRPWLARLNTLYQRPTLGRRFRNRRWFPKPVEGHMLWDMFHPMENSAGSPPLTEEQTDQADTQGMQRFISDLLRFSGRARFMNKNTRNARRIRYLQKIFPDALFIHVIRDGRAVTNSLLNIDWWPTLPLWWIEGKTATQLQAEGMDPVLVAARHWKLGVERVLYDKEHIPPEQYLELRYEKLMQDPTAEVKRTLRFCDLPWSTRFESHIQAFRIQNRNFKWADRFTVQQTATIEQEIGPLLERLKYPTLELQKVE